MMQESAPEMGRENNFTAAEALVESTAAMNEVQTNDVQEEETTATVAAPVTAISEEQGNVGSWKVQPCSVAFACLYTKHKTQKRKIWHDGRLVLGSCQAVLYDANSAPGAETTSLGECELTTSQRNDILQKHETRLVFEQHLVEIQGLWNGLSKNTVSALAPVRSQGMQKVLTKRFRKPGAFVPPDPTRAPLQPSHGPPDSILGKRRRPLQPGELQQKYYGNRRQEAPPAVVVVTASAWEHQVTPPPPVIIQSTPRLQALSSQRNAPFVTSDQLQDTERWSPRRQNESVSEDSRHASTYPPHMRDDERTTMQPGEFSRSHRTPALLQSERTLPQRDLQRPNRALNVHVSHPSSLNHSEVNTARPADKQPARQRNQFLDRNGFDPKSFFGEEEQEEDDSDDDHDEVQFNGEKKSWLPSNQPATNNERQLPYLPTSKRCRNQSRPAHDVDASRIREQDNSVLSRHELLHLFATASSQPPESPIPERMQRDETAMNAPKENRIDESSNTFELMLPSASESSSDDDSV